MRHRTQIKQSLYSQPPILPPSRRCQTTAVRTGPGWIDGGKTLPIIEGTARENGPSPGFAIADFLMLGKKWLENQILVTEIFDYLKSH